MALLVPAQPSDRALLESLLQFYAYDLSADLGLVVGDDARFRTPSLDPYWKDPRCHPFLLRFEGELAGFALVQERSRLTGDEQVRDLAEFFVMRRLRRKGVGEAAARSVFDRFGGRWEVRERRENAVAIAFWRRVIGRYTQGRFEETMLDDDRWRGPVQRFDSGAHGAV
jgi:predicted acetyltransferase